MKKYSGLVVVVFIAVNSFAGQMIANSTDTIRRGVSNPIRFLTFSAARKKSDVLIEFSTPSESITSNYQLESSANGIEWNPIVSFKTIDAGNPINKYDFNHKEVKDKIIYYRVKQVFANNFFSFSPVIFVKIKDENEKIRVRGTSANSISLYFPAEMKNNVTLQMHSMNGQLLVKTILKKPSGNIIVATDMPGVKKFLVTISDGQNLFQAHQVIIN